jgi:hypothetical protein
MISAVRLGRADVMQRVTLRVEITGFRGWRLRKWAAILLLKLASYILGCKIAVSVQT